MSSFLVLKIKIHYFSVTNRLQKYNKKAKRPSEIIRNLFRGGVRYCISIKYFYLNNCKKRSLLTKQTS